MLKAQQIASHIVEEYKVPDKLIGLVIGRGGKQLHRLHTDTQCQVKIAPDANDATNRNLRLAGSQAAIEHAKRSMGGTCDWKGRRDNQTPERTIRCEASLCAGHDHYQRL